MGKFEKLNKGRTFDINVTDAPFVSLKEMLNLDGNGFVYSIRGFFLNTKGKYGHHYIAIVDNPHVDEGDPPYILVDMPSHLNETFNTILSEQELIDGVRTGDCGFTIYTYDSAQRKGCYSIRLVDIT